MQTLALRRRFALVVLPAFALAACTSDSSSGHAFNPREAAAKIRALGSVEIKGHSTFNGNSETIAGRVGYRPVRVLEQIPVPEGQKLTTVQYRRIDQSAWVRRSIVTTPGLGALGLPLLVLRGPLMVPFVALSVPDSGIRAHLGMPYDPARMLDRLATDKRVAFRSDGSSTVKGENRDRVVASIPKNLAALYGISDLTVWIDDRGVPVQFAFTTAYSLKSSYTITKAPAPPKVEVPPTAQTETTNKPLPDATGDFVTVFTGTAGTTAITIQRAPGDMDWSCWKVQSDPAYQPTDTVRAGSGAVCIAPILDSASDDEKFAVAVDANATTPYDLLAIAVPPGSTASGVLIGGKTVDVPVAPIGLAVYAGTADQAIVLLNLTTPSGTKMVCGPGEVNSITDAAKVSSPETVRGQPWNCITEETAKLFEGS